MVKTTKIPKRFNQIHLHEILFDSAPLHVKYVQKGKNVSSSEAFAFLRLLDLQSYEPELQHYKEASGSLNEWIEVTRKKQDALQATNVDSIQALKEHIDNQKVPLTNQSSSCSMCLCHIQPNASRVIYVCQRFASSP